MGLSALVVVAAVVGAGFGASAVSVRWARTTSDLFAAIRPPGPLLLGAGLAAEHLLTPVVVLAAAGGSASRSDRAWPGLALATGLVALAAFGAAAVRRLGLATPGDLAVASWSDRQLAVRLHRFTAVAIVVLLVPVLQVGAAVVETLAPIGHGPAVAVIATSLVLAVLVFRGRGSLYAQPVRLVTLAAGLAAGAVVARGGAAGTGGLLVPSLPVGDPGLVPAASLATAVLVGTIVAPQLWPRLQAARDPASSRQAAMVAGALVAGLTVAAVAAGAADGQGEASAPTLAGQVASGLLAGGIVSGCLASGSALLLASTGAGQRLGARPVPTWIATASAAAGLAVAWHDIGLLTVLGWGFSFTAASLAPVVAAGCWWRSASSRGARWGASTGAALTAGAIAAAWVGLIPAGPPSLTVPALVCLPVALAVTGLVSLGSVDDRASHRPAAGLNPT